MSITIGIDPGASGAIGRWDGKTLEVWPFPTSDGELVELIREECYLFPTTSDCSPLSVWCEKVGAMPKQGVSSTFKFGHNAGLLKGVCLALGLPFQTVTPQKWQKGLGIPSSIRKKSKTAHKAALQGKAMERFPNAVWHTKSGKCTRQVADAALITMWGVEAMAGRR